MYGTTGERQSAGARYRFLEARPGLGVSSDQGARNSVHTVGADPGIMPPEDRPCQAVSRAVIAIDAVSTELERQRNVAAELGGRPATMNALQQKVLFARPASKRDQLFRPIPREIEPAPLDRVDPLRPRGLEQRVVVIQRHGALFRAPASVRGLFAVIFFNTPQRRHH